MSITKAQGVTFIPASLPLTEHSETLRIYANRLHGYNASGAVRYYTDRDNSLLWDHFGVSEADWYGFQQENEFLPMMNEHFASQEIIPIHTADDIRYFSGRR